MINNSDLNIPRQESLGTYIQHWKVLMITH